MASAVAVWGVARAFGGRVLLRLEDHDRTRSRPEFARAIVEDLVWLGLVPDEPVVSQSERHAIHERAFRRLETAGLVYACSCSRKSIEAEVGPGEGETRYPGTCREGGVEGAVEKARRVRLERVPQVFHDLRLGRLEQVPSEQGGDLLIRDRHGQWTYQFAVTVDDFDQGVDLVIRGEDLLSSTGRQIQLSQLLGRKTPPAFLHHPLIQGPDGRKLSKSNRETGIRELRAQGVSAEQLFGRAAFALGLGGEDPLSWSELVALIRRQPAGG